MTTAQIKFHGTDGETWTRMDQVAEERGYNAGYKYEFSEVWPKYSQPGVTVFESFYYRHTATGREKLHVICENHREREAQDKASKLIIVND